MCSLVSNKLTNPEPCYSFITVAIKLMCKVTSLVFTISYKVGPANIMKNFAKKDEQTKKYLCLKEKGNEKDDKEKERREKGNERMIKRK